MGGSCGQRGTFSKLIHDLFSQACNRGAWESGREKRRKRKGQDKDEEQEENAPFTHSLA